MNNKGEINMVEPQLTYHPLKTELVCPIKLKEANGVILVSISGGADSDIVIDLVERHKGDANVKYVWFNTGLEYDATKRHLDYLRKRYSVEIVEFKAVVPIPTSCRKHGVPFLSKLVSDEIERLQKHDFKWEDKPFEVLLKEYPRCKQALRWWCNDWGKLKSGRNSSKNISNHAYLKEFLIENPPPMRISPYCCNGAKKRTKNRAIKQFKASLNITGERRSEGGARSTAYKSCFSQATDKEIAKYRPLFFWSDNDRKDYEREHNIIHSDCYEIWGMKRTGCAGCPFGSRFEEELKLMEQYEPKLYNAALAIFGQSYEYTRKYREYKERRKKEAREAKKATQGATKSN